MVLCKAPRFWSVCVSSTESDLKKKICVFQSFYTKQSTHTQAVPMLPKQAIYLWRHETSSKTMSSFTKGFRCIPRAHLFFTTLWVRTPAVHTPVTSLLKNCLRTSHCLPNSQTQLLTRALLALPNTPHTSAYTSTPQQQISLHNWRSRP